MMGSICRQELEDLSAELQRRRELLETLSSGSALRAARLTGMPKAPRGSTQARFEADRIGAKMAVQAKISRLERMIMDRVTVITDHDDEILHAREKALLLRLRFLDCKGWSEVQEALFGREPDFREKYLSYKRCMFRLLNSACADVWAFWSKRTPSEPRERTDNEQTKKTT